MSEVKLRKGNFCLDWLEFTYRPNMVDYDSDLWSDFLCDFPEFEKYIDTFVAQRGRLGYTHVLAYSDEFKIMMNPDELRMGVHVQFPGHGLYRLAEMFGLDSLDNFSDVYPIFKRLKDTCCKITRMDIFYDDYEKHFYPRDFAKFMLDSRISSKTRQMNFITSEHEFGATFYLGARKSERYLRIYDKNYQSKGQIDAIRYELELKGSYARAMGNVIANKKEFCFADVLSEIFYITNEYDTDSPCSRDALYSRKKYAGVLEEWEEFLETIRKIPISDNCKIVIPTKRSDSSFEKTRRWVEGYLLTSLYKYTKVYGFNALKHEIQKAESKLNDNDRAIIKAYDRAHLKSALLDRDSRGF